MIATMCYGKSESRKHKKIMLLELLIVVVIAFVFFIFSIVIFARGGKYVSILETNNCSKHEADFDLRYMMYMGDDLYERMQRRTGNTTGPYCTRK